MTCKSTENQRQKELLKAVRRKIKQIILKGVR